jgi:hypothetical protein
VHRVIKQISFEGIKATGRTNHLIGNQPMPKPASLQIAQYDNDAGFYLFYLNEKNEVMTDTWHETIEEAMDQAEWEFQIVSDEWTTII